MAAMMGFQTGISPRYWWRGGLAFRSASSAPWNMDFMSAPTLKGRPGAPEKMTTQTFGSAWTSSQMVSRARIIAVV